MNFLAAQTIAGTERLDRRNHFVLQSLATLEVALGDGDLRQELAYETADGRIAFRGLALHLPINLVGK
jgi:hypothetical protein